MSNTIVVLCTSLLVVAVADDRPAAWWDLINQLFAALLGVAVVIDGARLWRSAT